MQTEVKENLHAEIKEKQYSILQIALNLAAACVISGIIIAITFYLTHPIAVEKKAELDKKAMQSLVKDADTFKAIEGKAGWFTASSGDKLIAYIVPVDGKGFGGPIKILAAITPEGKDIDFTIIEQKETPGLGDNASKDSFRKQFEGKEPSKLIVVKDPSNKDNIQAMTGATITSRAVTNAIKEAEEEVLQLKGGK